MLFTQLSSYCKKQSVYLGLILRIIRAHLLNRGIYYKRVSSYLVIFPLCTCTDLYRNQIMQEPIHTNEVIA
jgi:hypothetical protein